MRLLHTSDWHIGKTTYNVSRRPDHEAIAAEIAAIARDLRPDLILHTGDLFDASMPAVDDMRLGIEFLDELARIAPVVVVCGNHENPKLFAFFQQLRGSERLRFIDRPRAPLHGGILEYPTAAGERIRLACLPFVRNSTFIAEFGDPSAWTSVYADNLATVERMYSEELSKSDFTRDIPVFAAHLHVTGAVLAKSEREVHIDDYATRPEAIPTVSYAAFGHIHKPQEIGGRAWARYAGSPMQIDFGEVGEKKSVVFVETAPGVNAKVRTIELSGGRPLRRIEGDLDAIAAQADGARGSLVKVVVRQPGTTTDLYGTVERLLTGSVILDVDAIDPAAPVTSIEVVEGEAEPGLEDLFATYLDTGAASAATSPGTRALFEDALRLLRDGRPLAYADLFGASS